MRQVSGLEVWMRRLVLHVRVMRFSALGGRDVVDSDGSRWFKASAATAKVFPTESSTARTEGLVPTCACRDM
jgi:hypothetical protein